jgi:uncharacterized protein (DUF1330 family)
VAGPDAPRAAKGYWIGRVDIHDPAGYAAYVAANGPVFARFGGRFLVRGGPFEAVEGGSRARNVVIEFDSHARALACWHAPEYQALIALRAPHSLIDLIIIEGYAGPQPGEGAP